MKLKCESVLVCGNYQCSWNREGHCTHNVIALDHSGKCVLEKPKANDHAGDPNESF